MQGRWSCLTQRGSNAGMSQWRTSFITSRQAAVSVKRYGEVLTIEAAGGRGRGGRGRGKYDKPYELRTACWIVPRRGSALGPRACLGVVSN
jgi:hypothetical protein